MDPIAYPHQHLTLLSSDLPTLQSEHADLKYEQAYHALQTPSRTGPK